MHIVFFDLEATGITDSNNQRDVEIIEIGAVFGDKARFGQHVIPACDISAGATRVTGVSMRDRQLFLEGIPIQGALDPREALIKFHEFLKSICGPSEKVALVAHSCHDFDSWVLCHNLRRYNVDMSDVLAGFLDTFPAAYSMGFRGKLSMNALMVRYLGRMQPRVHGAGSDAKDLPKAMAVIKGEDHKEFCVSRGKFMEFGVRMRQCNSDTGRY